MTRVTLIFAGIKFGSDGLAIDQLHRRSQARIEENRRYQMPPSTHFLNVGVEKLKIKGVFANSLKAQDDFNRLLEVQKKGEPHLLITGSGKRVGKYYLKELSQSQTEYFMDIPTILTVDISLLEAVE